MTPPRLRSSTATSIARSCSMRAKARSSDAAGPRTDAPIAWNSSLRFFASRNSSSTSRIRRSRKAASLMFRPLGPTFRYRQRDRAMDAVFFEGETSARAELIGQRLLDQLAPLAAALRPLGRHGDAAFLQVDVKPWLAPFAQFAAPAHSKPAMRLLEGAVFDGVGRQLMQSHGESLHRAGAQAHALRPVKDDAAAIAAAAGLRRQFARQQFVERDPLIVLDTREQPLDAAERRQALLELGLEVFEGAARPQSTVGDGADHADQVAGAMLQLADQHMQPLLAVAQGFDRALGFGHVEIDADHF